MCGSITMYDKVADRHIRAAVHPAIGALQVFVCDNTGAQCPPDGHFKHIDYHNPKFQEILTAIMEAQLSDPKIVSALERANGQPELKVEWHGVKYEVEHPNETMEKELQTSDGS